MATGAGLAARLREPGESEVSFTRPPHTGPDPEGVFYRTFMAAIVIPGLVPSSPTARAASRRPEGIA